uniref:Uncharacterized protein n=1 Tax=Arundo donax TaxID=35708 RepID=A0A0A9DJR9_ARUDO
MNVTTTIEKLYTRRSVQQHHMRKFSINSGFHKKKENIVAAPIIRHGIGYHHRLLSAYCSVAPRGWSIPCIWPISDYNGPLWSRTWQPAS